MDLDQDILWMIKAGPGELGKLIPGRVAIGRDVDGQHFRLASVNVISRARRNNDRIKEIGKEKGVSVRNEVEICLCWRGNNLSVGAQSAKKHNLDRGPFSLALPVLQTLVGTAINYYIFLLKPRRTAGQ